MKEGMETRMDQLTTRVASRFVRADQIPMGKTWEKGSVRIHHYRNHFKVTDLTNAGKRGKRVRVMNISPTYRYKGNHDAWFEQMGKQLPDYPAYDRIKSFMQDILVDYPGEIALNEFEERGVDVNPGGTVKIEFDSVTGQDTSIEVRAEPNDFMLIHRWKLDRGRKPDAPANDSGGEMYQDTIYSPANKASAKIFYNWLQANLNEAKRMTIVDFRKLWGDLKIQYDYH